MMTSKKRCLWAGDNPLNITYHDQEWGVPVYDERLLFEFLILEGMQAGLSWLTILKKRENFRESFDNFNAKLISEYNSKYLETLLSHSGIIRNQLKINSVISNAKAFLQIKKESGSFSDYIWQFVNGKPIQNRWRLGEPLPAKTAISDTMSRDLKKRGFKFVGSTICYAFMQAVGMVNDHSVECFRYQVIKKI